MTFKSNTAYYAKHTPTGEEWHIIGISLDQSKVCVAGYPPTIAKIEDCSDFEEVGMLSDDEIKYRKRKFGNNWI